MNVHSLTNVTHAKQEHLELCVRRRYKTQEVCRECSKVTAHNEVSRDLKTYIGISIKHGTTSHDFLFSYNKKTWFHFSGFFLVYHVSSFIQRNKHLNTKKFYVVSCIRRRVLFV